MDIAPYDGQWLRQPGASSRGWITTWRIKHLLTEDEDSQTVARVARDIHAKLEKLRVESCGGRWADDEDIAQVSDEFHTIGHVDGDDAELSYFNTLMSSLYDWADAERVIIG